MKLFIYLFLLKLSELFCYLLLMIVEMKMSKINENKFGNAVNCVSRRHYQIYIIISNIFLRF